MFFSGFADELIKLGGIARTTRLMSNLFKRMGLSSQTTITPELQPAISKFLASEPQLASSLQRSMSKNVRRAKQYPAGPEAYLEKLKSTQTQN